MSTRPALKTVFLSGERLTAAAIIEYNPFPSWLIQPSDLSIKLASRSAIQQYQYTAAEWKDINFLQLFPEKSKLLFLNKMGMLLEASDLNDNYEHAKKDGSRLVVQLHASSLILDEVLYYQVSAADITAQVNLLQARSEEALRYKTLIEKSTEGIFCQEFSVPIPIDQPAEAIMQQAMTNTYLLECNDAMAQMYGYKNSNELTVALPQGLLHLKEEGSLPYLQTFIGNGFRIVHAESKEKDRQGEVKYFLNNAIGIIENGMLVRIWGIQKNITERKKNEEKLRLLANLVEQTSDILTAADLDYKPITWNRAAERIYGISAEQAIGHDLRQYITICYQHCERQVVRKTIEDTGEWRGEAFFVRPTDKKTVTLWMSFKLLRDESEQSLGYLISAIDITERKESELRLRESETRFRDMADSAPVMIWMTDENNRTTYINKEWLNFTKKEITGSSEGWSALVHPDDIKRAKKEYSSAFENKQQVTIVYRLLRYDGVYRWVHDVSVPRFLNDGTFIGFIGSVVDIEEEKQKQEQLVYQATVLENVSDIVIATDLEYHVKNWNRAAEFYYGIPASEAIGKSMGSLVQFSYNNSSAEAALHELNAQGKWEGEVSYTRSTGETNYFLHTLKYVFDEEKNKIGFLAVSRDITERKKIEEQLQKSEAFYRTLIADSLDGTILANAEGNITFASPSVKNVLGFDAPEVLGRNLFEFVHPADMAWAFESFQKEVIENPEVKFITVRLLKKSGDWVWCMVRGHNLLKNPSVNSIVVYFHDDTLRKQANDALKESEKRFRHLIRDMQIGVVLQDKSGKTILCNNEFSRLFRVREEEIINENIQFLVTDPIHEDGRPYEPEERPTYRAIHTGRPARDVVMGMRRRGEKDRIWIIVNADPIFDENGAVLHIICSVKDITERKKMEEDQIARQINHQRQLTQASIDGQENERKEIGKELHDNIGQQLTTIKLFLDMAKTTADDHTNEMVSMALKGVSDVINEVRTMSRSLVPYTLKDLGLIESVNELTEALQRTQLMAITFESDDFIEDLLPENQQLTLFRIIQEQLNNIVKYAEADNLRISLKTTDQEVRLDIVDDGIGFDPKKIRRGLGFMNITNRAALFEGTTEVITEPGKGCRLTVRFPLVVARPMGS